MSKKNVSPCTYDMESGNYTIRVPCPVHGTFADLTGPVPGTMYGWCPRGHWLNTEAEALTLSVTEDD
jgi:hypothetical protein